MIILAVEPDKILVDQYRMVLAKSNDTLIWSKDAQSGILSIDNQQPDLIILELVLAKHSGMEFLHELRSYPEWQNIPVVIISRIRQDDSAFDLKAMKSLGIVKYIYKPDLKLLELPEVARSLVLS